MSRAWIVTSVACAAALLGACAGGETGETAPSLGSTGDPSTDDDPLPSDETSTGVDDQGGTSSTTDPPDPDTTTSSSSGEPDTGSSSDDGCPPGTEGCTCLPDLSCNGELLCLGSTCQPAQCDGDLFEPNDDEASAWDLGMINDTDANGGIVSGSLHHAGDVDWYRYQGDDDITGNVDPAREIVAVAGLRMCKFLECDNGLAETEFECPPGTDYALSPGARPGCCTTGGEIPLPDLNCTGVIEDNAMVYIRVDQPAEACVSYSVAYHY